MCLVCKTYSVTSKPEPRIMAQSWQNGIMASWNHGRILHKFLYMSNGLILDSADMYAAMQGCQLNSRTCIYARMSAEFENMHLCMGACNPKHASMNSCSGLCSIIAASLAVFSGVMTNCVG
ncbi:hypothetical protein CEXT_641211 [Caerostris extrusa]|uniref:Uncharacterized protein n=1 Tax=Caerostris extrusa TaxID=172846 RepID=A0AAV4N8G5_CAEEX|nr:hypothetical protein CEXT_641211 [Caerostris extrusa]